MRMPMVGSFTLKPGFILLCFQPHNPLILLLFWRPFCLVWHLVQCIIFSSHISTYFGLHQTSACSFYDGKYCTLTYQFMICEIWGPEAKVLLDLHCTVSLYSKPKGLFSEKLGRKKHRLDNRFFFFFFYSDSLRNTAMFQSEGLSYTPERVHLYTTWFLGAILGCGALMGHKPSNQSTHPLSLLR